MAEQLSWFLSTVWPWIIVVVNTVVAMVASGHVVLTKRDSRAALGWIGVIWLAPLVGSLLYFSFGINRIQRKARLLRGGHGRVDSSPADLAVEEEILRRVLGEEEHLTQLANFVSRLTHLPLLDGNRLTPLTSGRDAYDQMLSAIVGAKRSVCLMTYIFDNDEAGERFVAALADAHQRGIAVRVLIDDVGARYTWPSIKRRLRQHHVPLAIFLPTLIPGRLHYANLRNHRKILVVDGTLGFTGGMNIRAGHMADPSDPNAIHDLHFKVEGPMVGQLAETFAYDWEFASDERLDGPDWFPRLSAAGQSLCRGISDGPDYDLDKLVLTILGAIACARQSVDIVTPYFLPEQPLITALNVAAMRGVAVNIILPDKNNLKFVEWACMARLWQVLERGCRVWLTPPPFDHSKLMVVDNVWSFVGSANWDPRSLRLNFEFNIECYDRELAGYLAALALTKRSAGRELTLADVDGRPLWRRLRDGVARLALPYL